ncbi:uncharacterized protein LOC124457639 isoform X2 [Xenia sp. Carnegie-2017]|uniref:uncharacterized protein LOC124457639 isoform X2 n=1 Tax=Xenia sp. Carnegie-2017 TaxID=2897299 RepID=UPI001F03F139|nr:uncharacterized protein LOC124457639 isoform X2 [Xenia sp. Carnegie-2017]
MSRSSDIQGHLRNVAAGRQTNERLEFDPTTGKLRVARGINLDNVVATKMACSGFFGGGFSVPVPGCLSLHDSYRETIHLDGFHIFDKSDFYKPRKPGSKSANYGGLVLYGCRGLEEWVTKNGTHCEKGCIVILNTDSKEVKKYQYPGQEGQVHGAIYECAFGEKMDNTVVGEGFSIQNEKLKFNSVAFNCNKPYRDRKKEMSKISQKYIKLLIKSWMKAGPLSLGKLKFGVWELDEMIEKNNQENPVKRNFVKDVFQEDQENAVEREFDEMTIQQDKETPIESTKLETMSSDRDIQLEYNQVTSELKRFSSSVEDTDWEDTTDSSEERNSTTKEDDISYEESINRSKESSATSEEEMDSKKATDCPNALKTRKWTLV